MRHWFTVCMSGLFAATAAFWSTGTFGAEEPAESQCLTNPRQVTSQFVKAGEGYFSPDGETIIFQAVEKEYPFYRIFTMPLAGGEARLVSTGRGRTTCSYFHPDGDRILFASSHLDPKLEETEAAERAALA